jgi:hypothetical protein
MVVVRIIAFLLGLGVNLGTLFSAIKQTVLPGRKRVLLSQVAFRNTFRVFRFVSRRLTDDAQRERALAVYAPISTMLLPLTWVILLIIGNTAMFWSMGVGSLSLGRAMTLSGAALTTEGFFGPQGAGETILYIIAGIFGISIISLLITFLPTVYSIYSQREQEVTRVAFRFGAPPSGIKLLEQTYQLGLAQQLGDFWHAWEEWFSDMYETHLSNIQVVYYRSAGRGTSWITTAGAILDAAALYSSTVDQPDDPWLALCFRAGCRTLGELAAELNVSFHRNLAPGETIYVTQAEYAAAYDQLRSAGVPLKLDREACWRAFRCLRCEYDVALITLALLVYAPKAPWSSDRQLNASMLNLRDHHLGASLTSGPEP